MFMIKIACLSQLFVCEPLPRAMTYITMSECNRALVQLVEKWAPTSGAYSINCRKVTL